MDTKNTSKFHQKNQSKQCGYKGNKPKDSSVPKQKKSLDLEKMDYFIQNDKITQMENINFEYKHFSCATILDQQYEILTKLINAFMNTQGGYAFVGIDNTGIVKGRRMTREERNEFKNRIGKIVDGFIPQPEKSLVIINFLPVKSNKNNEDNVEDIFVIRITVKKGEEDEVYCTDIGKSYYRLDGQTRKYNPEEYQMEFLRRKKILREPDLKSEPIKSRNISEIDDIIPAFQTQMQLGGPSPPGIITQDFMYATQATTGGFLMNNMMDINYYNNIYNNYPPYGPPIMQQVYFMNGFQQ